MQFNRMKVIRHTLFNWGLYDFIIIYIYAFLQGATIKAEEGTGRILIARVMHGGAADRSGLISCGDEVIEVNGVNVEGKTPNDVLKILVTVLAFLGHR